MSVRESKLNYRHTSKSWSISLKKLIVISIVFVILVVLVDVFYDEETTELVVLVATATEAVIDGDYVVHLDCTYSNAGVEGTFVVWAKLTGTEVAEESEEITLGNEDQRVVRFIFTGAKPPDTSLTPYQYVCGHGFEQECLLTGLCPTATPGIFEPTE